MKPRNVLLPNPARVLPILAVLLGFLLLSTPAMLQQKNNTRIPDAKVLLTIKTENLNVRGITFAKEKLWLLNARTKTLDQFDLESRKTVASLAVKIKSPTGLAWDGTYFWCLEDATKSIYRIHPRTPKPSSGFERRSKKRTCWKR